MILNYEDLMAIAELVNGSSGFVSGKTGGGESDILDCFTEAKPEVQLIYKERHAAR
ncbi:MAG: hypothetical protein ACRDBO_02560 [Lachnospiraceae bacterium]